MSTVPAWAQVIVAALLVLSGVFVLVSALGFLRLKEYFVRMHRLRSPTPSRAGACPRRPRCISP